MSPTTALPPLPPMMAIAVAELKKALEGPPCMGDMWPFKNPPRVEAALAAERAKGGRPTSIQPNQVVRLVRYVKLGANVTAAAKRAGLSRRTAQRVLAGQLEIAHNPAVTAAGVFLPPHQVRETRAKPRKGPNPPISGAQGNTAAPPPSKNAANRDAD